MEVNSFGRGRKDGIDYDATITKARPQLPLVLYAYRKSLLVSADGRFEPFQGSAPVSCAAFQSNGETFQDSVTQWGISRFEFRRQCGRAELTLATILAGKCHREEDYKPDKPDVVKTQHPRAESEKKTKWEEAGGKGCVSLPSITNIYEE